MVGDRSSKIVIWSTLRWEVLKTIELDNYASAISFDPSGRRIAVSMSKDDFSLIKIWETNSDSLLPVRSTEHFKAGVRSVSFSPSGKRILASTGKDILSFDFLTGKLIFSDISIVSGFDAWKLLFNSNDALVVGASGNFGPNLIFQSVFSKLK